MTEPNAALRERIVNTIRFLAIDAVEQAKSGHPGAPMGLAAAAFELWQRHLRFDPRDPQWPLRDRFVLSNGHASMLLYSLLHLFGYDLALDDLKQFRQLDSRTPGHPEYGHTAGVETTTGPLGQGFANGVGMALAAHLARSRFARDGEGPGHHLVYGIVSDGDLMEGVSAEAGSLAGHLGLGNLVYLYDDNHITIDGGIDLLVQRGRREALQRAEVARAARGGRQRPRRDLARDRRREGRDRAPVVDPAAHDDRLRLAAPGRQVEDARRTARRRGSEGDQGGARLAARADLPRARRRARVARDLRRGQAGRSQGARREASPRGGKANPALADSWDAHRERRIPKA